MPAVTRLCRQGLLLVDGRLARTGTTTEVVQHYLSAGLSQAAERQWPAERAPEHPCARLRAVRLFDDQTGELADTVDIRHPVRLEIEYENRPSDRHVYANIQLFDANNICLFASGDFNNREWRHQPRQFHGVVTSSCLIPGNFLAEGQFRVLVGLTTHNPNEVLVLERDAVSFVVVDHSEGDGVRGEFAGPYPGALRPSLEWRIARHDLPPSP
jgi:lipopolysaccharide transport system ATP-binding protein